MTQSRNSKKLLALAALLLLAAGLIAGCATPEDGSAMPWNRPEETQDGSFFGIGTY